MTGSPSTGPAAAAMPWRANLSCSRPLDWPTAKVRSTCDAPGSTMPKAPLAATSSRVKVCLSITIAMRGGVNSTGIDQAAAMTLRRPPCALVTSTVGPWLSRRLACARATGRKCGFIVMRAAAATNCRRGAPIVGEPVPGAAMLGRRRSRAYDGTTPPPCTARTPS
jgi:hypothetical protein